MNKLEAMAYLRSVILQRFPPGSERRRWLNWLSELSDAENILRQVSPSRTEPGELGSTSTADLTGTASLQHRRSRVEDD